MNQLFQKYPIFKKWEPIYIACENFYKKNAKLSIVWGIVLLVIVSFSLWKAVQMNQIVTSFQNTQDRLLWQHMDSETMKNALNWWNLQQNWWQWIPSQH